MSKIDSTRILLLAALAVFAAAALLAAWSGHKVHAQSDRNTIDYTLSHITATDALGRKLPDISGYRTDRYVGLFYFTWMGQQGEPQTEVYDITKLLRTDRDALFSTAANNSAAPNGYNYFFNEPLYGYYNSQDPYIIRKHLELFLAAGVDFIALDFTNGIYYGEVLSNLLDIYLAYQTAGWDVPKLMFFTNTRSGDVVAQLYKNVYRRGKYDSLWFRGSGEKPMIIAWEEELAEPMREFFAVRPPQWPEAEYDPAGWPYVEKVRPQRLFTNLMSVSVAQHTGDAFSFSVQGVNGGINESWGRGYTSDNPVNGNVDAILRGDNFQEQWNTALAEDPEIVFVTGWNEWTALKLTADWAGDTPFWVDTFNTEFSRDIEMTKTPSYVLNEDGTYAAEGYGDNYYLQLLSNIRAYKGIGLTSENYQESVSKTIDLNGDDGQWDDVTNTYLNLSEDKIARDHYGYVKKEEYHYTQAAPDNFITSIKVTHDSQNLYFRLETKEAISERDPDAENWMNLLIGIESAGEALPSWEGFQYIINRKPESDTQTSLEKVAVDGKYEFAAVSSVSFTVNGNVMQLCIPRGALGIGEGPFSIRFKAADSIEHPEDIMDYYVSGDAAPMGRLAYTYAGMTLAEFEAQQRGKQEKNTGLSVGEWIAVSAGAVITAACGALIAIKCRKKKQ